MTIDAGHPHVKRVARENGVLFAACRLDAQASDMADLAALDWSYLLDAANRQGVMPLVATWLPQSPHPSIDGPTATELHHAYWSNHFRNQTLLSELDRLQQAARAAGVELMPLKGAALVRHYYPRPALRVMSDLDLLVRNGDRARIASVLRALQYRPIGTAASYVDERFLDSGSREHGWMVIRDGLEVLVELRTTPLEPAVGRLTDLDHRFTRLLHEYAEAVWHRAGRADGSQHPRMSPEDLLLQVATHLAAKHLDFRLIWLRDIACLAAGAPSLDWDYVARTAERLRVAAPVSAALAAAVRWLGARVDHRHLARVARPLHTRLSRPLERWDYARLMRYVDALGSQDLTTGGPVMWPLMSALSRVRGVVPKVRVLRWVALPSRAYLTHRGITAAAGPLGYAAATLRRSGHR